MDHTKMPMNEVLTPDEKLVADFIKTRTKKVLDDIQRLSKEQNADISEWAESFAYLARTYGRDSDETFKWFKYYFREGMIPANVALPLVVQVYLDSSVDGGFVNTFAKAFKQEPEDVRNQRLEDMTQELAEYIDSDGNLTVYRCISREQIENFLFQLTSDLIMGVVKEQEQAANTTIPDKDKRFIADFYKYSFVGIMLDWIKQGMKEDYGEIARMIAITLHGGIANSIRNFTKAEE